MNRGILLEDDCGICGPSVTFFALLKSFLGSGCLALPFAFRTFGWLGSIIGTFVIAFVSDVGIQRLLSCVADLQSVERTVRIKSYGEVGYAILGVPGQLLGNLPLLSSQFGFCCCHLVFVMENVTRVVPSATRITVLLCVLPPLLLLVLLRSVSFLSRLMVVANGVQVFAMVFVVLSGMLRDVAPATENDAALPAVIWSGLPMFFGIGVFAFEGIGLVLPLRRRMRKPRQFVGVAHGAVVVVAIAYSAFASMCLSIWRNDTKSIVLLNLDDTWLTALVRLAICFVLLCTYPLSLVPVVECLEQLVCPAAALRQEAANTGLFVRNPRIYGIRGALVAGTAMIALATPNFEFVASLVGAVCNSMMGFIVPCILHSVLFRGRAGWRTQMVNICVILAGFLGMLAALRNSFVDSSSGPRLLPEGVLQASWNSSSAAASSVLEARVRYKA